MAELVPEPLPSQRASDADRDRVLRRLSTATSDGRLDVEEHHELMERALKARTVGELAEITKDLGTEVATPEVARAVPEVPASPRGMFAFFGARSRKGGWQVPTEMKVTALFGAIELDYRDAVFDAPEVLLIASSAFGAVEITVPDDVRVIDEGSAIFGAREQSGPVGAVTPKVTLRLRGTTVFGAVEIKHRPGALPQGGGAALPPG